MATQSTRDHLIEVGLQRIRFEGYTATGLQEVLEAAEVSKGSFYHYFPSKEAFAEAVLQLYADGEAKKLEKILSETKVAPLKRLRRYFEALIAPYESNGTGGGCLMGNLSLEVADHSPSLQSLLSRSFASWQGGIMSALVEAKEQDALPKGSKPEDLAIYLVNGWEGALVRMKADKSTKPLHDFVRFTFSVVLKK